MLNISYCRDKRRKILIYYDNGVSISSLCETLKSFNKFIDSSLYKVEVVNSEYLRNFSNWEIYTDLIVIPGGRSLPYYKALGKKGNNRITNYVYNGGKYLGICAGGYYGASKTVFEKGYELEVIVNGSLNFYQGVAEGPAYGLGEFKYGTENGAHAAIIDFNCNDFICECSMYFNGGCYFHECEDENENAISLARYVDLKDKPAAIVECEFGSGRAILSGVHFEYIDCFENNLNSEMVEKLKTHEDDRKFIFKQIVKQILI